MEKEPEEEAKTLAQGDPQVVVEPPMEVEYSSEMAESADQFEVSGILVLQQLHRFTSR